MVPVLESARAVHHPRLVLSRAVGELLCCSSRLRVHRSVGRGGFPKSLSVSKCGRCLALGVFKGGMAADVAGTP